MKLTKFKLNKMVENVKNLTSELDFTLMIIPGNGGCDVTRSNWYPWLNKELTKKYPKANIICENMPDPVEAREIYWMPFIKNHLKISIEEKKDIYVVGHSSGAVALMRLVENTKITGGFIVAGCVSHLGDENELNSGYYPKQPNKTELRPWQWDKMKENTKWLINICSEDDCFIPIFEGLEIKEKLGLEHGVTHIQFTKEEGKSHFMFKKFPELFNIIVDKIGY